MRRIAMFACFVLKPSSRRIVEMAGAMAVVTALTLPATQPAGAVRPGATAHHAATEAAYFEVAFPPTRETFVIEVTDPAKIQQAREILRSGNGRSARVRA